MIALKWKEENKPNAAWAERYNPAFDRAVQFLELSKEEQKRELKEKEKLKRMKIIGLFSVIITIAFVITAILTVWALNNQKRANLEKLEAETQRQKAETLRQEAEIQSMIATLAQCDAEAARGNAEAKRQIAQDSEKEARAQREIALQEKAKADQEALTAEVNEYKAHIEELIAGLNREDTAFGKKLAKAKELAAQSLAETRDVNKKAKLVIDAYRHNASAYINLEGSSKSIFEKLSGNLPARINGEKELSSSYDSLKGLFVRLQEKAKKESVPGEIFEALRRAYIANENQGAVFFPAESRALAINGNHIIFNDWEGNLVKAPLKSAPNTQIPLPREEGIVYLSGDKTLWTSILINTDQGLYCASRDGRIVFWNMDSREENEILVNSPSSMRSPILAMVYSRNKNSMFYSVRDTIYTYDLSGKGDRKIDEIHGFVRALALIENREHTFLLYANGETTVDKKANIYCLDLSQNGRGIKRVAGVLHSGGVHAAAYNDDKKLLALGTEDGKILIRKIDCKDLEPGGKLEFMAMSGLHKGIVKALAFSPGGRYMASGGLDNTIMLWDLDGIDETAIQHREPVLSINNNLKILSVVFDSAGEYMIFSDEQYLQVCPTRPEILYNELCSKVGENPGIEKSENDDI